MIMAFLYHFTDLGSLRKIAKLKRISSGYGAGVTFSGMISNGRGKTGYYEEMVTDNWDNWLDRPRSEVMEHYRDKIKYYIKIDVDGLGALEREDGGLWRHRGDLDLSELATMGKVMFGYCYCDYAYEEALSPTMTYSYATAKYG